MNTSVENHTIEKKQALRVRVLFSARVGRTKTQRARANAQLSIHGENNSNLFFIAKA